MEQNKPISSFKNSRFVFRIGANTLSFATLQGENHDSFVYEPYTVHSGISMSANLREAFKENALLSSGIKRAWVFLDTPVVMVPLEEFVVSEKEVLYNSVTTSNNGVEILHHVMPEVNAVALFPINKDLKLVLTDNIEDVRFAPVMRSVWRYMHRRSFTGVRKKLFVYFHDKKIDIFCFNKNRFKFTNSFDVSHSQDAVYFMMHVWQLMGYDVKNDELFMMGKIENPQLYVDNLQRYINKVYVINPIAEFNRHPITQVKGMSLDLIIHFIKR